MNIFDEAYAFLRKDGFTEEWSLTTSRGEVFKLWRDGDSERLTLAENTGEIGFYDLIPSSDPVPYDEEALYELVRMDAPDPHQHYTEQPALPQ